MKLVSMSSLENWPTWTLIFLALVASVPAVAHIATGKYQDLGWAGIFICGVVLAEIHDRKSFKLETEV